MKEFLIENWKILLIGSLSLISLLINLLKKNKLVVKDTIYEQVLEMLPGLIINAEKISGEGVTKKSVVLSYALSYLKSLGVDDVSGEYAARLSNAIEAILSTPTKKEEK